jgi:hypothetical protein
MLRSPIVSLNKNPPSSGGPLNAPEPHRTMATVKATHSPAVIASCSMSNATNKSVFMRATFYRRLRQQCWVHAFARSDFRTDGLSETEFNGAGRLRAYISFNRIGILHAAMRSAIRGQGNRTMKKKLAIAASMAVLMTITGQALAETTAHSDRQAVYAYNAFDRAVATDTDATNAYSYHGGPKYND